MRRMSSSDVSEDMLNYDMQGDNNRGKTHKEHIMNAAQSGHTKLPEPVAISQPSRARDDMSEPVLPIVCCTEMSREDGEDR